MRLKSWILTGVLGLASVGLVSAKSHEVILSTPTMAGTVQLPAGQYSLKVEDGTAVFRNVDKDTTFTVPVKEENGTEKFDQTQVMTDNSGAAAKIVEIDLGGSHTKLEFSK